MHVVLVSARIELIFLTAAGVVLCFGFRLRIMLITHQYCRAVLAQSPWLPSSLCHLANEQAWGDRGTQEAGGTQPEQLALMTQGTSHGMGNNKTGAVGDMQSGDWLSISQQAIA